MIDRTQAKTVFQNYAAQYDRSDPKIALKIAHTYRVAELADSIARSFSLTREEIDFAWLLGLLHDIGRFEQVRRYGTFVDRYSIDHAELGADILFNERLIERFPVEGLSDQRIRIAETAIRMHNKLKLSEDLDQETAFYCNLLRDADKVDIFRVVAEVPFEERVGSSMERMKETGSASDDVMRFVYAHACVPRVYVTSEFAANISLLCMGFELVSEESRSIAAEQGYLLSILEGQGKASWNEEQKAQMHVVRKELESVMPELRYGEHRKKDLRKWDAACVRVVDCFGDVFEGFVQFNSAEYNEHEFGRYEDALQMERFLFYESGIHKVYLLEDENGLYGRFSEAFGTLEELTATDDISSIEDVLESEETDHVLRLIRCIAYHLEPENGSPLANSDEVIACLRKYAESVSDEVIQKELASLENYWNDASKNTAEAQ